MTTGSKISKLRKENNYTQEQLAVMLGVSRQAISKWENDVAYPETDKILKLSEYIFGLILTGEKDFTALYILACNNTFIIK